MIPINEDFDLDKLISEKTTISIYPYIFFNNQLVPAKKAVVSVAAHSLQYGTSVFAGIRGYYRDGAIRVLRLKDHYKRLMNASKILGFGFHISYEGFEDIISSLIKVNKPTDDIYFRPFIFCDETRLGPKYERDGSMEFVLSIYMCKLGDYAPKIGLNLKISSTIKYSDNSISTKAKVGGSYINSFIASYEAIADGYDDVLVMDNSGFIVEANVANILVVYKDRLMVPILCSGALEGITISSVKELLEMEGYKISESFIDRSTIYCASELVVAGTAMKICYTSTVDKRVIGNEGGTKPGKVASLAMQKFNDVIEMNHQKSKEWINIF